jgi:hypothetical protein
MSPFEYGGSRKVVEGFQSIGKSIPWQPWTTFLDLPYSNFVFLMLCVFVVCLLCLFLVWP